MSARSSSEAAAAAWVRTHLGGEGQVLVRGREL